MSFEERVRVMFGIGVSADLLWIRCGFLTFAIWFTSDPDTEMYVSPFEWICLYAFWYLVL